MTPYRSDSDRFRPMVHRRDRRWEIHAGTKRFAIVLSDHRSSAATANFQIIHHSTQRPASRLSITKSVGLVLAVIAGTVTIGIATLSTSAHAGGSYVVSVPIPQRTEASGKTLAVVASVAGPPRAAIAAASRPARTPYVERDASEYTPPSADEAPVQMQGFTTRQAAIAAAIRTGSFQQWTGDNGDERGFIVAGPADNGCRQLSILVRLFGGDDKVETRRECTRDAAAATK
jgi:hypothetical protein